MRDAVFYVLCWAVPVVVLVGLEVVSRNIVGRPRRFVTGTRFIVLAAGLVSLALGLAAWHMEVRATFAARLIFGSAICLPMVYYCIRGRYLAK